MNTAGFHAILGTNSQIENGEKYDLMEIIFHPDFKPEEPPRLTPDVAIIKLAKTVHFERFGWLKPSPDGGISTICFPKLYGSRHSKICTFQQNLRICLTFF